MYFDSHSHISGFEILNRNISKVISLAEKNQIVGIVDSGIDNKTSSKAIELSKKYPDLIYAMAGLHPEIFIPGSDLFVKDFNIEEEFHKITQLIKQNVKFVKAIGECGLDFYWLGIKHSANSHQLTAREIEKVKNKQKKLFKLHIELAQEVDLPLVIHSRGAEDEALEILINSEGNKQEALFHSFTGGIKTAEKILQNGFYISFNGILTFPKAEEVRDVFKFAWQNYPEQILSETDAPYLAPESKRGETAYPSDVVEIVNKMSDLAGEEPFVVASQILQNSFRFFQIPEQTPNSKK